MAVLENIINDPRVATCANAILSFTLWLIFICRVLYLVFRQQSYNLGSIKNISRKEKASYVYARKNIFILSITNK